MAEEAQDKKLARRRVRRLRWWVGRVALWFGAMAVLGAVLISITVLVVYAKRTAVINFALERLAAPYYVEVGEIEFPLKGKVAIGDVRITTEEGGRGVLDAATLELEYTWTGARNLRLEKLTIEDPKVELHDAFFEKLAARKAEKKSEGTKGAGAGFELGEVVIRRGELKVDIERLPKIETKFDIAATELGIGGSGEMSVNPVNLSLRELGVRSRVGGEEILGLPSLDLAVRLRDGFRGGTVERFALDDLVVRVTPELLEGFKGDKAEGVGEEGEVEEEVEEEEDAEGDGDGDGEVEEEVEEDGEGERGWVFEGVEMERGRFSLSGFDAPEAGKVLPDVSFGFGGELAALKVAGGKVASDTLQRVRIYNAEVRGEARGEGGIEVPAARIRNVVAEFIPDALLGEGMMEKLHVEGPALEITGKTVGRFLPETGAEKREPDPASAEDPARQEEVESERKAWVVRDLAVSEGTFTFMPEDLGRGLPNASGEFTLRNRPGVAAVEDEPYRAALSALRVRNPGMLDENLAQLESITIDFSALGVQRERRIDQVDVNGFHVTVGNSLMDLLKKEEGESEGEGEGKADAGEEKPKGEVPLLGWKIGLLNVKESTVAIQDILPQLPVIDFGVQTLVALEDLTVGGGEGRARNLKQRVELVNLDITSPLNPSVTVANLKTIFVEFTIGGLLNREIELVEVLSPDIFLGEHLFWYIDYQRQMAKGGAGGEGASEGEKEGEAAEAEVEAEAKEEVAVADAAEEPEEEGKAAAATGWRVNKIDAFNGRLIFAPKGWPVGFNPFPFSVSTDLKSGKIDLELEVPKGRYTFEEFEIELDGLEGKAQFNVPLKQKDNNFVETFSMERLRYKKYEATDVWLTITYDKAGIYPRFGGAAYGGYINGELNVYVGEKYSWDASVSGTDIDLLPLTKIAAPDNVLMEGRISGTIVGGGLEKYPGLMDGSLEMLTPGRLEVTKLNEMLEKLPEDWSQLKRSLAEIGITRLRDFAYTEGSGSLGFLDPSIPVSSLEGTVVTGFEREEDKPKDESQGILMLGLKGPEGSRSIDLRYHGEQRGKGLKKKELSASNR